MTNPAIEQTLGNEAFYLELLKSILLDQIGPALRRESLHRVALVDRPYDTSPRVKRMLKRILLGVLSRYGLVLYRRLPLCESGKNGPEALTLVDRAGLDHVEYCIRTILADGVPGDLIETGVWRGGASIFMAGALRALGDTRRLVWVADSFEGLPRPDPSRFPVDAGDLGHELRFLAVTLESVQRNFEVLGLPGERVRFVKGWFSESLPCLSVKQLAVMRLDGDLYESTFVALEALYPKLQEGGFVIIDDYSLERCRRAVKEYRDRETVQEPVLILPNGIAYWRKRSACDAGD